ncbi:PRC-barrel domain-containing protein [Pontivivens nitratireducens]|uniref:PRC-barrel domain-containing protein n=1 Tax=Pontivivens nitratireducens TaxID=2758038 RepID=UPI0016395C19|nr:PRC-barrel domain-containing protein [Pontibrevibacter nitratireducens]
MKHFGLATLLLAGTAITPASAQDLNENCSELYDMFEQAGNDLSDDFADAGEVALLNDDAQCVVYIERVAIAGSITATDSDVETARESFSDSETITQEVEITTQAIVEGDVLVRVPQPEVAVDQSGADISVNDTPTSVTVDQQAADILVRQSAPRISVAMPTPTITIEQEAPEIIVTMPRPGVNIYDAEPTVEVIMAEPTIRVTQQEPQLDVNVQARFAEEGEEIDPDADYIQSRTEMIDSEGNTVDTDVVENFELTQAESTVRLTQGETDSEQVTYNTAEPVVRFESAEPIVEFQMDGEPTIDYQQLGEARVTFREFNDGEEADEALSADLDMDVTPDTDLPAETGLVTEGEADLDMDSEANALDEESSRMLGRTDASQPTNSDMFEVVVDDLYGMSVENLEGEDLGEFSRVVANNGRMYAIIEHGGFLGLGESEVALPLDRMMLGDDRLILQGLTEDELEALPEYDSNLDLEVETGTRVQIMQNRG